MSGVNAKLNTSKAKTSENIPSAEYLEYYEQALAELLYKTWVDKRNDIIKLDKN